MLISLRKTANDKLDPLGMGWYVYGNSCYTNLILQQNSTPYLDFVYEITEWFEHKLQKKTNTHAH